MAIAAPKVELYLNGAWVDVSGDVQYGNQVTITRGRTDEAGQTQPSSCSFRLDNRSGNYSPRNPAGTYFGSIGRTTPCRVSLATTAGTRGVLIPDLGGGNFSTPDSANLSITGDIDLRLDIALPSWRVGRCRILYKGNSYYLGIQNGFVLLEWYSDATTLHRNVSTETIPMNKSGRLSIRATLDVNNGASGHTTTFYTGTGGVSGSWTQLGDTVITATTTAIYDSANSLYLYNEDEWEIEVFGAQVLQGIAGTVRANPDFTAQTAGATSFADAQGNTWSASSWGRIDNRDWLFWGAVMEWPQSGDPSGQWRWVDVVATGPLRRLQSGATTFSPMTTALLEASNVIAYWPGEDGTNATGFSSGLSGGTALTGYGTISYGSSDTASFPGAAPMAVLSDTARMLAPTIPGYTGTGNMQVRMCISFPAAGLADGAVLLRLRTTGTAARWDLTYLTGGALAFDVYAADGSLTYSGAPLALDVNGYALWVSFEFETNGSDIDLTAATLVPGDNSGFASTDTATGVTLGVLKSVEVNPELYDLTDVIFGQLVIYSTVTSLFDLVNQLKGFKDETADDRVVRLLRDEADNRVGLIGYVPDTEDAPLGYQQPGDRASQTREAETQDSGLLTDAREFDGVVYRTGDSMLATDPLVTVSWSSYQLSDYAQTEDDQYLHNDFTVTRTGGGSARAIEVDGELGTGTVGTFSDEKELSLAADTQALNHAWWRMSGGTIVDPRWPTLVIDVHRTEIGSDTNLVAALRRLVPGDHIRVTGVPTARQPYDIDAVVQQITEVLDQKIHRYVLTTAPFRLWDSLRWSYGRWSPAQSSTLASSATSTATSLSVASVGTDRWVRAADDAASLPFDINIAGERITVTAVSGTSSPQTFTVTRSVNGIVKAQSSGATVELWQPYRWAI